MPSSKESADKKKLSKSGPSSPQKSPQSAASSMKTPSAKNMGSSASAATKSTQRKETRSVSSAISESSALASPTTTGPTHSEDDIRGRIAQRAYELYEQRGWRPGNDMADWLEAERQIRAELSGKTPS